MSGGCCGLTSAKVASIITIIIGSASIIAAIVTIALTDDLLFICIPVIIGATMFVLEGVVGLIYVFNAKNRCWMITANVVSIIMLVISAFCLIGGIIFAGIFIVLKVGCDACGPDDYCEDCGIPFEYTIPGGVAMIVFSIIFIVTSIMLVASSCLCCRKSNMDSAVI